MVLKTLPERTPIGQHEDQTQTRSGRERRCGFDRRNLTAFELHCARLCHRLGVRFVGVQRAYPQYGLISYVLVLNSYDSSFAVPTEEFNEGTLLVALERSERPWVEADDRAADLIAQETLRLFEARYGDTEQPKTDWQALSDELGEVES